MNKFLEIRNENRYILIPQGKKRCTRCLQVFDISFFPIRCKKENVDNTRGYCNNCDKDRRRIMKQNLCKDPKWYCKRIITQLRHRAKELNVPFDLSSDELYYQLSQQEFKCFYTQLPLDFTLQSPEHNRPHDDFPSIDRSDPSLGYVKGNVTWCLYRINRMKNDMSHKEFVEFCHLIHNLFSV